MLLYPVSVTLNADGSTVTLIQMMKCAISYKIVAANLEL